MTSSPEPAAPEVGELVRATERWVTSLRRDDLLEGVRAAAERLDATECRVVIIGEFKKGKSSLINALLNARVCPTDADIATAVPNLARYGPRFRITAVWEDGSTSELDPDEAQAAALGRGERAARELRIELPRDLLRAGLVLVDTPGVGGGLASSHAGVALHQLGRADVVLFVSDAGSEYAAPELELLARVRGICGALTCVVTMTDLYPQWSRIVEANRAHLRRIRVDARIVTVSAVLRHAGLSRRDDQLLVESGFPALTMELLGAIDTAHTAGQLRAAAAMYTVLGHLSEELTARRDALMTDRPAAANAETETARVRIRELRGVGGRWQQMLNDRVDDLFGEMELDLTQRLRALRRGAAEQISQTHPSRLAADLGPWLQAATNETLLAHTRRLQSAIEDVADAVADQFGSLSWELRSVLDLAALRGDRQASPEFTDQEALERRMTRFEVGLAALRGGATGAMVTHAVGLVVGIAVPVVIPAAVALSAILGGKSWQTAREHQLRAVRAEAERAVASYLEGVDVVARKDTRDTLRRTRRELRDVFAKRAAELLVTATRAVEAVEAAAAASRTDEQQRRRERTAIEQQLAELTDLIGRCRRVVDELAPLR